MTKEEAEKVLEELNSVRPEQLKGEAKKLFEAIMKIADERDELKKKAEEQDKIIDLIIKELYRKAHISTRCYLQTSIEVCMKHKNCYECLKQYFENKAKEVE